MSIADVLWMTAGGAVIWLSGAAVQPGARTEGPPDPDRGWRAAGLGLVITSLWTLVLLVNALPMARWMLVLPAAALWGVRIPELLRSRLSSYAAPPRRPHEARPPRVAQILILAWALTVIGISVWRALSHTMDTPAGMGIWGYKAKLFCMAGMPADFLTDPSRSFAQLSYPLGFPLTAVWFSMWIGRYDDHLLQILPPIFLAAALLYVVIPRLSDGRRGWTVAGLACALFSGVAVLDTADSFYPEPMLWFLALVGLSGTARGPVASGPRAWQESWLLIGACAWVKNEGLLVVVAAVVAAAIMIRPRRAVLAGLGWALAAALPWRLTTMYAGVGLEDFKLSWPGWAVAFHRTVAAWTQIIQLTWLEPWRQAFAWPLSAITWAAAPHAVRACREAGFALVFALTLTILLAHLFVFSAIPELSWHLSALERLLVLPAAMLLPVLAAGVRSTEASP